MSIWWKPFWQLWGDISLWFWFAFPWWLLMLTIFSCVFWPSSWKMLIQVLCHFSIGLFIDLILSWVLYIFWILTPSQIFVSIFSHSVGCLFILLMFSFAVQKLLNLIRSYLFTVDFISFTLGDKAKKTLLWFMSECSIHIFL